MRSHEKAGSDLQQTHRSESNDGVTVAASPTPEPKNVLYKEFCRQLHFLLKSAGEMKPKEIGDALSLVQSQVTNWLNRAEQDGRIRRTSKKPAKFRLQEPPLL